VFYEETTYGFSYGAATIERCCSDEKRGWVALMLKTPKGQYNINVTKTGKVRIFNQGKELKAIEEIKGA
jgi:hypothetical protein